MSSPPPRPPTFAYYPFGLRITHYASRITHSILRFINHRPLLTDYCLLITLTLPALSRWFLSHPPPGPDTASHFFRAVQIDWLIQQGIFYSRWAPDLVFGYGYPLFNYYGALANYLIVALHRLGLPFIPATLVAFAVADLLGAYGAYLLGRDLLGKLPGLVAAAAYVYSPYNLSSLYRGTLPESLVFGLLPLVLWAFYRLFHAPTLARLVFAAALLAALPLLNNPGAAIAGGMLILFVGALVWAGGRGRNWGWVVSAGLLGAALSAFYWLPLLSEISYIQIERAYAPAIVNYHSNFLSLAQLFALPQPLDPALLGQSVPVGLGLPQAVLALLAGVIQTLRVFKTLRVSQTREQKILLGVATVGALVLLFLTLPQSVNIWETLPGLSLIQFPARLLGPASLLLALLAAETLRVLKILRVFAVAAFIFFGFGWMYTGVDRRIPAQPVVADIHAFEHRTGVVGTTAAAEFLPVWVTEKPPDNSLAKQYAAAAIINRLDPASLPAGATILSQTPGPLAQKVVLESPVEFSAVFNLFYFPGWIAKVDGQAVSVEPTPVNGLASFPVPAGKHTLELQFTDTPPRTAGNLISLAALFGLTIIALWSLRSPTSPDVGLRGGLPASQLVVLAAVSLTGLFFKTAILDRSDNLFFQKRFDGQTLKGVQYPLNLMFGDEMQLLGYDEQNGEVILYWRTLRELETDWSVSVTLDYGGQRVAQNDSQHPAGLPTSRWFPDQYGRDAHRLEVRPGAPPGRYDLRVTVYRQSDGLILQPTSVKIGEWAVARPAQPATLAPAQLTNIRFGPVTLVGIDMPGQINVGELLPVTFYWQALQKPDQDYVVQFRLEGNTQWERSLTPTQPDFPTGRWQTGDAWLGSHAIRIPADQAPGAYTVRLKLSGESEIATLGQIRVNAPERVFTALPMEHPLQAQFGEIAELIGWGEAGGRFTLYWRARRTAEVSYIVFVHLLDSKGHLIAQRDRPPADSARPTTSWLAGEIITDAYDLALPEEAAAIRVGLYDPTTGDRLRLPDGNDFVLFNP